MRYMAERCGAWQVGDDRDGGEVEFRVFLPDGPDPGVDSIRVAGSFQGWDFPGGIPLQRAAHPEGTVWTARTGRLPAGFYEYKYLVDFGGGRTRIVSDPCTRYGGFDSDNAAVVVGGSPASDNVVRPLAQGRRPLVDLNVYELMIDDFTAGYRAARAPLDAVVDRLDYLRDLGFNAILFMPWTAWKGDQLDWGYAPFQYFSVEARYAHDLLAPAEKLSWLKRLISECHDRGIHVIMDGVFNHVDLAFPYKDFYADPARCPYTATSFGGTFAGLQDLDFAQQCTRDLIDDVCRYWIDGFGIDGIRFDNTVNYFEPGTTDGLPHLIAGIRAAVDAEFSTTLEHIAVNAGDVAEQVGATSYWDNALYERTRDALRDGHAGSGLLNALNTRCWRHSPDAVPTLYLTDHDHPDIARLAGLRAENGAVDAWFTTQPYAIALFTSTAVPLVRNGQEFGEDHFLPEDDKGTGRRVLARPLRWKQTTDSIGRALLHLYGTLAHLRLEHPALRSAEMYPRYWEEWQTRFDPTGVGIDVEQQLAVYHRWAELPGGGVENAVVVLNLSDTERWLDVPFPLDGPWTDLLGGEVFDVTGHVRRLPVPSHYGRVLLRD